MPIKPHCWYETIKPIGLFMIYLDALIVNVALPAIQSDFKEGESGLQWVVTAYSLGTALK
jgi:MFS family permease